MKNYIALLAGILALPAYAEVAPISLQDFVIEEVTESEMQPEAEVAPAYAPAATSPRQTGTSTVRVASSRSVPNNTVSNNTRNVASTRATVSRSAVTPTTSRTASSRTAVVSRSAATPTKTVSTRTVTPNVNTARSATSSIVQTNTVSQPLYNSTSSRVSVRPATSLYTAGASTRSGSTATAASVLTTSVVEDTVPTTADIEQLAQMTDFCKAQYTECMDNFCNVLDDNQGRCSCSPNIENYADTELALEQATEQLQAVAQEIQYIGLSADDIEVLFAQTEAEAAMQGKTDTSQLASDLENIKKLVLDVDTNTSFSNVSNSTFDFSNLLDFSNSTIDIGSLFGTTEDTSSISNQRGAELYKTASARCKAAVLNTCSTQGVDTVLVANTYDMEIDKQCIAYERNLTDANATMKQTVLNAQSVLQKARLAVAQDKNSYDLRGCITALDGCMQDDFVCGDDYEDCLDPSGKYIANGEVIIGSTPGKAATIPTDGTSGIYGTWSYNTTDNAWGNGTLSAYIDANIKSTSSDSSDDMITYLQDKIGRNVDGMNTGMCMSVLNKCQDYTYEDGEYIEDNEVVRNYMMTTLATIKVEQDEILSEYAESCQMDLQSCLVRNNYDETQSSSAPVNNVAKNACETIIATCESVTGFDDGGNPSDSVLADIVMGNKNRICVGNANSIETCDAGYECTSGGVSIKDQPGVSGTCTAIDGYCLADSQCDTTTETCNTSTQRCELKTVTPTP